MSDVVDELDTDRLSIFVNSNLEKSLKDVFLILKAFYEIVDWDKYKRENRTSVNLSGFRDYFTETDYVDIVANVEYGEIELRMYVLLDDCLVIKDMIFKNIISSTNKEEYKLFAFETLCETIKNEKGIMLNTLVSRDIVYDGKKIVEKKPIYYGDYYENIDSLINKKEIKEVLANRKK